MREETRDLVAREILIAAALGVVTLVLAAALAQAGYASDPPRLFVLVYFARWVVWAARRAAARPAQHPYLRRLPEFSAAGLVLIDLLVLVHGFRSGGPSLAHWLIALPLGTLAAYLFQKSARRHRLAKRA